MKKLQEARDLYSFNKMQNNDGNAMFKEYDSRLNKQIVYCKQRVTRKHLLKFIENEFYLLGIGNYFEFFLFFQEIDDLFQQGVGRVSFQIYEIMLVIHLLYVYFYNFFSYNDVLIKSLGKFKKFLDINCLYNVRN